MCGICQKHRSADEQPPGGYIDDGHWKVCHAPPAMGAIGTLLVESVRHFLDYAEMSDEEAASLGPMLRRIHAALKQELGAERVYSLTFMEGIAHFHMWLVPRLAGSAERSIRLISQSASCDPAAAAALVARLRERLEVGWQPDPSGPGSRG